MSGEMKALSQASVVSPHERGREAVSSGLPSPAKRSLGAPSTSIHVRGLGSPGRVPKGDASRETQTRGLAELYYRLRLMRNPGHASLPPDQQEQWARSDWDRASADLSEKRPYEKLVAQTRKRIGRAWSITGKEFDTTARMAQVLHEERAAMAEIDRGHRDTLGRRDLPDHDWRVAQILLRGYRDPDALLAAMEQRRDDAVTRAANTRTIAELHHQRRLLQNPGHAELPPDQREQWAKRDWEEALDVAVMGEEAVTGYSTRLREEIGQLQEVKDGQS